MHAPSVVHRLTQIPEQIYYLLWPVISEEPLQEWVIELVVKNMFRKNASAKSNESKKPVHAWNSL